MGYWSAENATNAYLKTLRMVSPRTFFALVIVVSVRYL